MTGRQESDAQPVDDGWFAELQDELTAFSGQSGLHQARGTFRDDDFVMRRDVIAMSMGNESERFSIRRIEPNVFVRQMNASFVPNLNHDKT